MIRLLRLTAIVLGLCLAGCACGRLGTLVARRTLTPTAEVVEVFGCGVLVRPARHDGGVSVGFRRATYIYPRLSGDTRTVGQSLHWGWVPLHSELPFFLGTRELGLEFQFVAGISMLHAGYVDQGLTFVAEVGESRLGHFHYIRAQPERTVLSIREEWEGMVPFTAANP